MPWFYLFTMILNVEKSPFWQDNALFLPQRLKSTFFGIFSNGLACRVKKNFPKILKLAFEARGVASLKCTFLLIVADCVKQSYLIAVIGKFTFFVNTVQFKFILQNLNLVQFKFTIFFCSKN